MECRICGQNYKLLANHVWQAHKISVPEYKITYDYPLTKALADDDWVLRMKEIGEENKKTDSGKKTLEKMIIASREHNKLRAERKINNPVRKRKYWPKTSIDKVNKMAGASRKEKVGRLYKQAQAEWLSNVPIKQMCVSDLIIYRWKKEGKLPPRKKKYINRKHKASA